MITLGWIIWCLTGLFALLCIGNALKPGQIGIGKLSASVYAMLSIIGMYATATMGFSKFHLLWYVPAILLFWGTFGLQIYHILGGREN